MVLGSGLGMMSSTVPVWQSEMSKVHKRGHHVIVDGICIAAGIAMASWLTFGFSKADTTSSWNWRLPWYVRSHAPVSCYRTRSRADTISIA